MISFYKGQEKKNFSCFNGHFELSAVSLSFTFIRFFGNIGAEVCSFNLKASYQYIIGMLHAQSLLKQFLEYIWTWSMEWTLILLHSNILVYVDTLIQFHLHKISYFLVDTIKSATDFYK